MEVNFFRDRSASVRIDKEDSKIRLVYRVTGKNTGTEGFSRLKPGEKIEALGPLGNGFPLEEAEGKKVFLIGGGIGIPPMLETAKQLKAEKTAVLGYRDELFRMMNLQDMQMFMLLQKMEAQGSKGQCIKAWNL